jgi:hypothetical protein
MVLLTKYPLILRVLLWRHHVTCLPRNGGNHQPRITPCFKPHQLSWSPYSIARGPMAPQPQSPPPPIPPPVPVETHPNRAGGLKPPLPQRVPPDPTRLAPEHAYYAHSQPRLWHDNSAQNRPIHGVVSTSSSVAVAALRPPPAVPGYETRKTDARKPRDRRRKKRKGAWKKLMWVRQSCMHTFPTLALRPS